MAIPSSDVTAALASLRTRWGEAAPRLGGDALGGPAMTSGALPRTVVGAVVGALATVPLLVEPDDATEPDTAEPVQPGDLPSLPRAQPIADHDRVVRTGFPELDAILGPGGVPRSTTLAVRGSGTSGRTTLALRLAAEAQAAGSIVAYVDLARSLDPVEAVARGVRLEWLVVLEPDSLDEALAMSGALVAGRSVDLLIVDLPAGRRSSTERTSRTERTTRPERGSRPPSVADRLARLSALARRADVLLVVLEPIDLSPSVTRAVAESAGLRLELARRAWIRLGRDVVGQRTEVVIARNRAGPPGRRAELRILYAEGGGRDACLLHDPLLLDAPTILQPRIDDRATPPPLLAASPAPPGPVARDGRPDLRLVPERSDRPRRPALDGRDRGRREPGGARARRPSGDGPRISPSAHA